eukprot:3087223-Rhodomonas_salina.2
MDELLLSAGTGSVATVAAPPNTPATLEHIFRCFQVFMSVPDPVPAPADARDYVLRCARGRTTYELTVSVKPRGQAFIRVDYTRPPVGLQEYAQLVFSDCCAMSVQLAGSVDVQCRYLQDTVGCVLQEVGLLLSGVRTACAEGTDARACADDVLERWEQLQGAADRMPDHGRQLRRRVHNARRIVSVCSAQMAVGAPLYGLRDTAVEWLHY